MDEEEAERCRVFVKEELVGEKGRDEGGSLG